MSVSNEKRTVAVRLLKGAAVLNLIAVILLFAGCAAPSADQYTGNFAGTWSLNAVEDGAMTLGQDQLSILHEQGDDCTLTLAEDGTLTLALFDTIVNGTWEPVNETEASAVLSNEAANITLADGKIVLDQGTDKKIVFSQGAPAEVPVADKASSEEAASSEAA